MRIKLLQTGTATAGHSGLLSFSALKPSVSAGVIGAVATPLNNKSVMRHDLAQRGAEDRWHSS